MWILETGRSSEVSPLAMFGSARMEKVEKRGEDERKGGRGEMW